MKRFIQLATPAAALALVSSGCERTTPPRAPDAPTMSAASAGEVADLDAFLATIPEVEVPSQSPETMLGLAAMPLACIDRPHSASPNRAAYLDDRTVVRRSDYETTRSFYGCYDWHSAVNSTWAMVRILKESPDLSVANLLREKLQHHLAEEALAGELEFFEESKTFERPYGWAWLMQLHAELLSWDDPDAREWAPRIAPLTSLFAERSIDYVKTISYPSRGGTHGNTAFALTMMLDFARATQHTDLERALVDKALEFYLDDVDCPTGYEPSASDFLSPCLEEAKLMSRVLETGDYAEWLDRFLPSVASEAFRPLTVAVEVRGDEEQLEETNLMGAKSHLIGLALIRAEALNSIAAALPENDPRVAAYRKLAAFHGRTGFDAMFDADYMGTHWIGTFALRYLLSAAP